MKRSIQPVVLLAALCLVTACRSGSPTPVTEPIANTWSEGGLSYSLVGEGPLVVLIHGTNLDRRLWDADVRWLKKQAKVLLYDLRGQGTSDFPIEPYSNHQDLLELLDELGESEAILVGLSAGAQVALDVALTAPQRVQRLVLVSPSLFGYMPQEMPSFLTDLMTALQAKDFAQANEVLLASPIMSVPPEHADRVRTMVEENERLWTIPYSLVELPSPLAIERLADVGAPTLVLVGEEDLAAVHAQGRLLEEKIPDAQQIQVAGGGHLLNLTSPDAFREAMMPFLGFVEH